MSGPTVQELLGLPSTVTQPSAYEVFGLAVGESDPAKIQSAIKQTIGRLKASKSTAANPTWTKAAKAVASARDILTDPVKKAELDAGYGIIAPTAPATTDAAVSDPLAGLLPGSASNTASGDSGAASPPPSTLTPPALAAATPPANVPQESPSIPPPTDAGAVTAAVAPPAAPVIRRRTPRRRRSSWGSFVLGSLILLALVSLVGGLGWFFVKGPGEVQFVKTDDGFTIKTGGNPEGQPRAAAPQDPVAAVPRGDGIMKAPPAASSSKDSLANALAMNRQTNNGMDDSDAMRNRAKAEMPTTVGAPPGSSMPDSSMPEPSMPEATTPDEPASTSEPPPPAPSTTPPTEQAIAVGDISITTARKTIANGEWDTMKRIAELAQSKAATPEQAAQSETLYELADLATFYRGAIQRAMASLKAGSEFDVTTSLKVLVVEASQEKLVIRRGAKNYTYMLNELPMSVAHAIAPMQLNINSPEGKAAKAAYQAITQKSTEGHREEAIDILRELGSVKGADTTKIAELLASLDSAG